MVTRVRTAAICCMVLSGVLPAACSRDHEQAQATPDPAVVAAGERIFRFETFGDESKWTDVLRLHEVIGTAVDPTTAALLKLNAVVGVQGTVESVNGRDTLTRVGITCALCHSTVDNAFAPGI